MRIEKTQLVSGLPAKDARDALRKIGMSQTTRESIARAFNVDPGSADRLIQNLVTQGLLEATDVKGSRQYFRLSTIGLRLVNANFKNRINRTQADVLLEGLLKRVREVNSRDELTYVVSEVSVFGSYLEDQPDFGDIDLAVRLQHREIPGTDWIERCQARAMASGRTFKSYLDRLAFGEREVKMILKARNPYLSLHSIDELQLLECPAKILFRAEGSTDAER